MNLFGLVLTIIVLVGIALFILLFERQRAERINRDLREMNEQARDSRRPPR